MTNLLQSPAGKRSFAWNSRSSLHSATFAAMMTETARKSEYSKCNNVWLQRRRCVRGGATADNECSKSYEDGTLRDSETVGEVQKRKRAPQNEERS